jgi:putative copper resistance protein D
VESALIAAVRAVHFAAAIVLFGQFAYVGAVSPQREAPPGFARITAWTCVLLLATLLLWLGLEALSMSGLPLREALGVQTLAVVATQTVFGRVWLARFALAGVLLLVVSFLYRHPSHRRAQALGAVLAALVLATIAGVGHGLAGKGADRAAHICADALHLLAAGAWLGGLLPLVLLLGRRDALPLAVPATQRFSTLGIACMAAILLSGVVNVWYMVADVPALVHTSYGLMVLAKISLFLLIIVLAGINRSVLAPRLLAGDAALVSLRRNAIAECVLGFGIVAIVGQLGITVPGPHMH